MSNLKSNATIVYESPDGGETVYGRYAGETERWMIGQSATAKSKLDELKEDKLWEEIRRAAKSNLLLQSAIERVKILYHLSKQDGKN
jgi:hypothetical protein